MGRAILHNLPGLLAAAILVVITLDPAQLHQLVTELTFGYQATLAIPLAVALLLFQGWLWRRRLKHRKG